jgi:hypothetical protein
MKFIIDLEGKGHPPDNLDSAAIFQQHMIITGGCLFMNYLFT